MERLIIQAKRSGEDGLVKKAGCMILSLFLVLSLWGCSGAGENTAEGTGFDAGFHAGAATTVAKIASTG